MVQHDQPVVTMSCLGKNGFFGNQLFQYAFLRIYAKRHGLAYQNPPWIGQYLFGLDDPMITVQLPMFFDYYVKVEDVFENPEPVFQNMDFNGYFHFFSTKHYLPHQAFFRSLFQPQPKIKRHVEKGIRRLRTLGNTIVAIHLRRGDYAKYLDQDWCYISPAEWYKDWLKEIWERLDSPVLYVASDELDNVLPDFAEYRPITARDVFDDFAVPDFYRSVQPNINGVVPSTDFYPDYYTLMKCDVLAISNSTFSFSASMLNERGSAFYRPDYHSRRLVPYDPWNSIALQNKGI